MRQRGIRFYSRVRTPPSHPRNYDIACMNAANQALLTKSVVCHGCDCFCPLAAKVDAATGRVVKVTTRDHPFLRT